MVLLFWIAAVLLVLASQRILDPISLAAAVSMKVLAIVAIAFGYMRLTARTATLAHAFFVGIFWLIFDIVAELVATGLAGHGWFDLIGSPVQPLQRDLMLITWVVAPAIFVKCRE